MDIHSRQGRKVLTAETQWCRKRGIVTGDECS
jgi:hypothetical protein